MCQVYVRCFICNSLKQSHKLVIITPDLQIGKVSELLSHLSKVTQPIGIQTQVCLISVVGLSP